MRSFVALATALCLCLAEAPLSEAARDPNIRLTVNSTSIRDGDMIKVSWTGVANATEADVVALFVPANQSVDTVVPVKYKWVNAVPNWEDGSGSFVFQMLNQRQDAIFYYFRDLYNPPVDVTEATAIPGFTAAGVSAQSDIITLAARNEPTQIHMSVTNLTGEMVLQWTTADKGTPTAKLGTAPGNYSMSATGSSSTYMPSDMCTSPANDTGYIFPGYFNAVLVKDLLPSTKYYYVVGDPAVSFSAEGHFTTAPVTGPNSSVSMIVWADSGQAIADGSYEWEWSDSDPIVTTPPRTMQAALATFVDIWQQDEAQQGASLNLTRRIAAEMTDNITLLVHQGDLSYARGLVSAWDIFMDQYSQLFRYAPYMVLPGNHERDAPDSGDRFWPFVDATDSGGECGVPMERRFQMPFPQPGDQWYSFDHGPVHFIQTSTEQPFGAGSSQWQFVVNDLMTVDRQLTPWVVVGFHRPFLTSSLYGHQFKSDIVVSNDIRSAFEEIFFQYQVDVTLSGHVHYYLRSCPVYQKTCMGYNSTTGEANGPVHVHMGNGGFEFTWFVNPTPPAYWDAMAMEHGYARVQANGTHFSMQAVSSDTGNLLDSFSLVKPFNWTATPKAKAHIQDYFISNYTASYIEDPGLSSNALWADPIFLPAAELLANNEDLLMAVYETNCTLVNNINIGDNTVNMAQIFDAYYKLIENPGFANASRPAGDLSFADQYINDIFRPLFEEYNQQTAKQQQSNGAVDAGLWLPQRNSGSPMALPTLQAASVGG